MGRLRLLERARCRVAALPPDSGREPEPHPATSREPAIDPDIDNVLAIERSNTVLYCRLWQATVDFYRSAIRLPVAFENEWFVEFQLSETSFLSIADTSRATIRDVHGEGITLTWQVADLARTRDALVGRGIQISPIKTRWQAEVCYFNDPEGHRIEIWADGR